MQLVKLVIKLVKHLVVLVTLTLLGARMTTVVALGDRHCHPSHTDFFTFTDNARGPLAPITGGTQVCFSRPCSIDIIIAFLACVKFFSC